MEFDDPRREVSSDSRLQQRSRPPWLRGALTSAIGALIGTVAFVVFCYSLGLNFSDEGWADSGDPWQSNREAFIGSLIGFAIAILIFWLGFIQITRTDS